MKHTRISFKKTCAIFMALFLFLTGADLHAQVVAGKLTVDLNTIALYDFDGNFQDSSPHGLHLQVAGNAHLSSDISGGMENSSGQALRVGGVGDQVSVHIPHALVMPGGPPSPLTIEARFYIRELKSWGINNAPMISLYQHRDNNLQMISEKWQKEVPSIGAGAKWLFNAGNVGDGEVWRSEVGNNAWHRMRMTMNAEGRVEVYVSGQLLCSGNVAFNPHRKNDWVLTLGNFDGYIDEVRVSNTVRTGVDEEVPLTLVPSISVSSDLHFGEVVPSGSSQKVLKVLNTGKAPLHVADIFISGADAGAFSVAPASFSVAPAFSQEVVVTFSPEVLGDHSATLEIVHNGENTPSAVAIRGRAIGPIVSVSSDLHFGEVVPSGSSQKVLKVLNTGKAPLHVADIFISGADAGAFSVAPTSFSVAPAFSQEVVVTFSPEVLGDHSATLEIVHNGENTPPAVAIRGRAIAPIVVDFNTIALYHFDVDFQDSSPHGLHLQAAGNAHLSSDIPGGMENSAGQALRIGGVGDHVSVHIPHVLVMPGGTPSPLTLEARFYIRGLSSYGIDNAPMIALYQHWDNNLQMISEKWQKEVPSIGAGAKWLFNAGNVDDGEVWRSEAGNNAWHRMRMTMDTKGRVEVYVSGRLLCSGNVAFNPHRKNDWVLTLGNFDGYIDEVRVSNIVRTGVDEVIALAPSISVSSDLHFGAVMPSGSSQKALSILNTGNAPLNVADIVVSGADAGAFSVAPTSFSVAPASTGEVTVTFSPDALGDHSATLEIVHNGGGTPTFVSLKGQGTAPVIAVSPETVDFGFVAPGSSAQHVLTVSNTGNALLQVTQTAVSGPDAGLFTLSETAFEIASGQSHEITLTFSPDAFGDYSATFEMVHNGGGTPTVVSLKGQGTAPIIAVSSEMVDFGSAGADAPAVLDFGEVMPTESSQHVVNLSNTGNAPLDIADIVVSGADAGAFSVAPTSFSVAPASTQEVVVTFSPDALGDHSATVEIMHNGEGTPTTVSLKGQGTAPVIAVSPETVDFGPVAPGSSTQQVLTVSNTGNAVLQVTETAVSGPDADLFTLSETAFEIAPGQSQEITLTFSPNSTGDKSGSLILSHNNPDHSPTSISLVGTGSAPIIHVSDPALHFGDVVAGQTSIQAMTVSNPGNATLHVTDIQPSDAVFQVSPTVLTIPSQGSETLAITFAPTAAGNWAVSLTLVSNDPDHGELAIVLSGTGMAEELKLDEYAIDSHTIALYHFNGDLNDSGPNGLHLTADGNTHLTADNLAWMQDPDGQVLRFNGLGDKVTTIIPDQLILPGNTPSAFSLEARIFPRAYKAYSQGNYPILSLQQHWDARFELLDGMWNNPKVPQVQVGGRDILVSNTVWEANVQPNAWHLLRITLDTSGHASVYVNGNLLGEGTVSMNYGRGNDWTLTMGNFDGDIDEVRLSNTVRSGTGPIISVPRLIDFGKVSAGTSVEKTLRVANTGTTPLTVDEIQLAGPDTEEFSVHPTAFVVDPGQFQEVSVQLSLVSRGAKQAHLSILHNAEGKLTDIHLSAIEDGPDAVGIQVLSDQVIKILFEGHSETPFDTVRVQTPSNFSLTSETDPAFSIPKHPVQFGRHHFVREFGGHWGQVEANMVNEVFLIFEEPMENGHSYTLALSQNSIELQTFSLDYDDQHLISGSVKANQVGYLPESPKYGYLGNWLGHAGPMDIEPTRFEIRDALTHEVVFSGIPRFRGVDPHLSGEKVFDCEFTELTTPGTYYLYVPGLGRTHPFKIADNVFNEVFYTTMRAFYYQRCGTALEARYAGQWARPACHLEDGIVHESHNTGEFAQLYGGEPIGSRLPATGGWHDAGDYGKYVPNSGPALFDLFTAYELFPEKFSDGPLNIPESGDGIPDILGEIKWQIDWLKGMQAPDGGVFHKLNTTQYAESTPQDNIAPRYFAPKTTQSTGIFAAVMAMAYRNFLPYWPEYARDCLARARKAWEFLELHPETIPSGGFTNPPGIGGGTYGDPLGCMDERAWAAAELYKATGEVKYHEAFEHYWAMHPPTWGWNRFQHFQKNASWAYATTIEFPTNNEFVTRYKEILLVENNNRVNWTRTNIYRHGYNSNRVVAWGTFAYSTFQAWELIMASFLLEKPAYLDYAKINLDVALGNNPQYLSYITGVGHRYPMNPHHNPSRHDNIKEPIPGLPVHGPHTSLHQRNPYNRSLYENTFPSIPEYPEHRKYFDVYGVVEMGELSIQSIAFTGVVFGFFSSGSTPVGISPKPALEMQNHYVQENLEFEVYQNYPNPFNPSTIIRYALPQASNVHLVIYNTLGQQVQVLVNGHREAGIHTVPWDGKDAIGRTVASGIYLYKLQAGSHVVVRKMVMFK